MALNLETDNASGIVIFAETENQGRQARQAHPRYRRYAQARDCYGRVVDANRQYDRRQGPIQSKAQAGRRPGERTHSAQKSVNEPMATGLKAHRDALIPIGTASAN